MKTSADPDQLASWIYTVYKSRAYASSARPGLSVSQYIIQQPLRDKTEDISITKIAKTKKIPMIVHEIFFQNTMCLILCLLLIQQNLDTLSGCKTNLFNWILDIWAQLFKTKDVLS